MVNMEPKYLKNQNHSYIFDIVLGAVMGTFQSPKLVRLHFGYLIGPNDAAWNDFRHTKNLKFPQPPSISHN